MTKESGMNSSLKEELEIKFKLKIQGFTSIAVIDVEENNAQIEILCEEGTVQSDDEDYYIEIDMGKTHQKNGSKCLMVEKRDVMQDCDSKQQSEDSCDQAANSSQFLDDDVCKSNRSIRRCCVIGCMSKTPKGKSTDPSLYTFPPIVTGNKLNELNIKRCGEWVNNCGNPKLAEVQSASLYKNYYVCGKHFTNDQFFNSSRKRLVSTAVPTIFESNLSKHDANLFPVYGHSIDMHAGLENNICASNETERIVKHTCAVVGCGSTEAENLRFFPFPVIYNAGEVDNFQLNRCKQWIRSSGNCDLLSEHPAAIHFKHEMCENHFEKEMFVNKAKKKLKSNAVPTQVEVEPLKSEQIEQLWITVDNSAPDEFLMDDNAGLETEYLEEGLDSYQKEFIQQMQKLEWQTCNKCKESFLTRRKIKKSCLRNNSCSHYTEENGMDPGEVPEELQDLTHVEELLISRTHPILSVYKVKGHQYAYSGNVINFSQSVSEVAKILPHKVSDLTSILTLRTQNGAKPKEFHVRTEKVRTALVWLKNNNPFYYDIEISDDNLLSLPEDGNVYENISGIIADESIVEEPNELQNEEEIEDLIEESSVPLIQLENQDDKVKNVFQWPTMSKEPINEFKTIGYIAQAFPCLFPRGKADLRSPRDKVVTPVEYFKHLLRYHDRRFAQHRSFRFFALNSVMRWTAINNGNLFVRRNEEFENMTVELLRERVKENPAFISRIMHQCSNMRGTKPYWKSKCRELVQMIEQLEMPTLFFTLSAADLHWPGLFEILCPNEDISTLSESKRRKLIQKNPIIVDKYFSDRVETFLNKVVIPKYNVTDHWYRVEYQHRGSPHVHGLLWLKDAPNMEDIKNASPEKLIEVIKYFDDLISTIHPDLNCLPAVVHPCRKQLDEIVDFKQDLAELLNKVQRHTQCTEGYCLKFNKTLGKKVCRFKFPKEMTEETQIIFTENGDVEFVTVRNDPLLNKYNGYIIQTWRANIDIAPVVSKKALLNYLAKYVSKSETKSKSLEETLRACLENIDKDKSCKSAIQSLYIRTCSERDYSAQEVGHLIMGEKLVYAGGRDFVNIYFKITEDWIKVPTNENITGKSFIDKYRERSAQHERKSLWHMAKNYILPSERKRAKEAIVLVYPILKKKNAQDENYYKLQVLLHVPWRDESDLIDCHNETWAQVFQKNIHAIKNESLLPILADIETIVENEEEETEEDNLEHLNIRDEDWMALSAMRPNQTTSEIELGRRAIDMCYNWNGALSNYLKYGSIETLKNFITDCKKSSENSIKSTEVPNVDFNEEQTQVLKLLNKQIDSIKQNDRENPMIPKRIVVQGKAGTGKSLLIKGIASQVRKAFGNDAILLLAPTGIASMNIDGSTVHSKLHVSTGTEYKPLEGTAARKFCNEMRNVKFIIIDEYSMIGCDLLGKIEKRCREATGKPEAFGGLHVFLFGDIRQLRPVLDTPLYTRQPILSSIRHDGKYAFDEIPAAVILSHVQRQNDPRFKKLLENMSMGSITAEDYKYVSQRFKTEVSSQETKKFEGAMQLFPTRKEVSDINMKCLSNLRHPVTKEPLPIARIEAKHNCPEAAKGDSELAGGLKSILYLGKHAKIMLKSNLWTEKCLVNGSMGVIVDILYDENLSPPEDSPSVLICRFDSYKGPYLGDDSSAKLVALGPISKSWATKDDIQCTRTTFPVVPAYACTIHKAQGMTLEKVVVNIGKREFSPGLSFVAFSRSKSLGGLLLEPFSKERLLKINSSSVLADKTEFEKRLQLKALRQ